MSAITQTGNSTSDTPLFGLIRVSLCLIRSYPGNILLTKSRNDYICTFLPILVNSDRAELTVETFFCPLINSTYDGCQFSMSIRTTVEKTKQFRIKLKYFESKFRGIKSLNLEEKY